MLDRVLDTPLYWESLLLIKSRNEKYNKFSSMFRSVIFPDKDWFQILKIDSPYISEINPIYQQWKNHLIIQIIHFLNSFFSKVILLYWSWQTYLRSCQNSMMSLFAKIANIFQQCKFPTDLVTFTEEILNGKHNFCAA